MKCNICHQTINPRTELYYLVDGYVHDSCPSEAQRSGVLQGCVPSATGSASAAPQEQEAVKSQPTSMASLPSNDKRKVDSAMISSGVQLPVSGLAAAVADQIAILDKEIELLKLRVAESESPHMKDTIRKFGSCLWRHKCDLERAIAADSTPSAAGVSGGS